MSVLPPISLEAFADAIGALKAIIIDPKGVMMPYEELPATVQAMLTPMPELVETILGAIKEHVSMESPVEDRIGATRLLLLAISVAKQHKRMGPEAAQVVWDFLKTQVACDYQSLRYTLACLLTIAKDSTLRLIITAGKALELVSIMLSQITLASLQQIARRYYLDLIKTLIQHHLKAFVASDEGEENAMPTGAAFLENYISAVSEEVDPDNLTLVFTTLADILIPNMHPSDVHSNVIAIFSLITSYFPIRFEASAAAQRKISGERLKGSLRRVFASTPDLAPYVIPFLVDKLNNANDEPTQIDVLLTMTACVRSYGGAALLALKNWPYGAHISFLSRPSRERWPKLVPVVKANELVQARPASEPRQGGCCGGGASKAGSGCCGGGGAKASSADSMTTLPGDQIESTTRTGGGCGGGCACKAKKDTLLSEAEVKREIKPVDPRMQAAIDAFHQSTVSAGFIDSKTTRYLEQLQSEREAMKDAPQGLIQHTEQDPTDQSETPVDEDAPEPFELFELWEVLKRVALSVSSVSSEFTTRMILESASQTAVEGSKGVWLASCACIRAIVKAICPDTIPGTVYENADTFMAPALADCLNELRIADAKLARAQGRILATCLLGGTCNAGAYIAHYVQKGITIKLSSAFLPRSQLLALLELVQNIVQGLTFAAEERKTTVETGYTFDSLHELIQEFFIHALQNFLRHSPQLFHPAQEAAAIEHDNEIASRSCNLLQTLILLPPCKLKSDEHVLSAHNIRLVARFAVNLLSHKLAVKPLEFYINALTSYKSRPDLILEALESTVPSYDLVQDQATTEATGFKEDATEANATALLVALTKAAYGSQKCIMPALSEVVECIMNALCAFHDHVKQAVPTPALENRFLRGLRTLRVMGCAAPCILLPMILPQTSQHILNSISNVLTLKIGEIDSSLVSAPVRAASQAFSMISDVLEARVQSLSRSRKLSSGEAPVGCLLDALSTPFLDELCRFVCSPIINYITPEVSKGLFKSAAHYYHSFIGASELSTQVTFLSTLAAMMQDEASMIDASKPSTPCPFKLIPFSDSDPDSFGSAESEQSPLCECVTTIYSPVAASPAKLLQPLVCAAFSAASPAAVATLCENGTFSNVFCTFLKYAISVPSVKSFTELSVGRQLDESHELAPIRHAITAATLQLPSSSILFSSIITRLLPCLAKIILHRPSSMPFWMASLRRQYAADLLSALARGFCFRGHAQSTEFVNTMLDTIQKLVGGFTSDHTSASTPSYLAEVREQATLAARLAVNVGILASPKDSLAASVPIRMATVASAIQTSANGAPFESRDSKDSEVYAQTAARYLTRELTFYLEAAARSKLSSALSKQSADIYSGADERRIYFGCTIAPFAMQRHFETTLPGLLQLASQYSPGITAESGGETKHLILATTAACANLALGHLLSRVPIQLYSARLNQMTVQGPSNPVPRPGLLQTLCTVMEASLRKSSPTDGALLGPTPAALSHVLIRSAGDVACVWVAHIIAAHEAAEAELAQSRGDRVVGGDETTFEQQLHQNEIATISEHIRVSFLTHSSTLIRYALSRISELGSDTALLKANEDDSVSSAEIAVFVILRKIATMPLDTIAPYLQAVPKAMEPLLDQPRKQLRRQVVATKSAWYAASVRAVRG